MQNPPLISIITVVFNAVICLERCVQSILNQKINNIELIIIDGGSTDGSIETIKKYQKNIAYWISEPDSGIYDAMNKGIRASKGEWLYFIGADDALCPNALLDVLPYMNRENPPLFIYGKIFNLKEQKEIGQSYHFSELTKPGQRIAHQSIFYHRRLFETIGLYQTKYKIVADHVFNLHCFARDESSTLFTNHRICNYSGTGASSNNVVDLNYYNSFPEILNDLSAHLKSHPTKASIIRQNFLLLNAEREILLGNYLLGITISCFYALKRFDPMILLVALGKLKRRVLKQMTKVC